VQTHQLRFCARNPASPETVASPRTLRSKQPQTV